MTHCHCSRCRKTHGAAFATYVAGPAGSFRMTGCEHVLRWESAPGFVRCFCARCGSVVPGDSFNGLTFVPAGNFDDDPGARPMAHIFAASKAPWFVIRDGLTCFDAYPPGVDAPVLPERPPLDPPGQPRGSCLCGGVAYVLEGTPTWAHNCHCGRCRRARSSAHASNLFIASDFLRFTRGEDLVQFYKLPEAEHFGQSFCRICGSLMPRVDRTRGYAGVPMGSLDDDPGMHPQAHIYVASKAPWYTIGDDLPQYAEQPT
jgi:hypothetical protein